MDLFLRLGIVRRENSVLIRGSGVDLVKFSFHAEPSTENPIVLLASRMLWDKGVGEFVDAANCLKNEGVLARFVLVGEPDPGNPASIEKTKLDDWVNSGVVEWWGFKSNMHEIFKLTSMVCLPSYGEGLPKVLLEALASGKPIITTDVPGCREVVYDNENGYLVPVKDSKKLADRIKYLLENPKLREHFGVISRQLAEQHFSIESVVEKTISLY